MNGKKILGLILVAIALAQATRQQAGTGGGPIVIWEQDEEPDTTAEA